MTRISFIICANNRWGDYASMFVDSIRQHESGVEVILVDNGSPKPYAAGPAYQLVRLEPGGDYNYMRALNAGAERAQGDWLIFCNDDILCYGKFAQAIEALRPDALYGLEIRRKDENWGLAFRYVYGWMLIVPRAVWEVVGEFDEYYLHAGFDDIDYSWRAQQAGFGLQRVDLPFVHLADQARSKHRRAGVSGFQENMARSKQHFLQKALS